MRRLAIAAVVVTAAACGGGGTNTNNTTGPSVTNHNPAVTASVSPTFGIDSLTIFTFTASATDADGDPMTYSWRIGNGTYGSQNVQLSFVGGGSGTGQVTVSDGKGGSGTGTTQTFTVGSMTGKWRLRATDYANWIWDFTLRQTSGLITGTFIDNEYGPGRLDPAEPSTISGNGTVVMRTKLDPYGDVYVRGKMDTTGRRITGTLEGRSLTRNHQPFIMDKIGS